MKPVSRLITAAFAAVLGLAMLPATAMAADTPTPFEVTIPAALTIDPASGTGSMDISCDTLGSYPSVDVYLASQNDFTLVGEVDSTDTLAYGLTPAFTVNPYLKLTAVGTTTIQATLAAGQAPKTAQLYKDILTFTFSTASLYTLAYDLNGAPGTAPEGGIFEPDSTITVAPGVTREGYAFLGWNTLADGTGTGYDPADTFNLTSSVILYAQWQELTATLTYNANGGEYFGGVVTDSQEMTYSAAALISDTLPARTGYTLLGWADSPTADSPTYFTNDEFKAANKVPEDATLYAVWAEQTAVLTYDANGGVLADGMVPAEIMTYTGATDVQLGTPVRENYVFKGWATSATATDAEYAAGDSYKAANKVPVAATLYALWQPRVTYTLTYDANGGSDAPAMQTETTETESYEFTVASGTPTHTAASAAFLGWADTADATQPAYAAGSPVTVTVDAPNKVLYAVWEYTYTLIFDKGLGDPDTPVPDTMTATIAGSSQTFTIPDAPIPNRTGYLDLDYVFDYWSTNEDRVENETQYKADDTVTLTVDAPTLTLYARYAPPDYYYLKYFRNTPGTVSDFPYPEDATIYITRTVSLGYSVVTNLPESDAGEEFLGWLMVYGNQTEDQGVLVQPGQNVIINGDIFPYVQFIAQWEPYDAFRLAIDYNNTTRVGSTTTAYGFASQSSQTYTFSNVTANDSVGAAGITVPTKDQYDIIGYATSQADANAGTVAYYTTRGTFGLYSDAACTTPATIEVTRDQCREAEVMTDYPNSQVYEYVLYPVWEHLEYYRVALYEMCGKSRMTFDKTEFVGTGSHEFSVTSTLSYLYCTQNGNSYYSLLGYSYAPYPEILDMDDTTLFVPGAEPDFPCVTPAGQASSNPLTVTVDKNDPHVTGAGTKGNPYTLPLYAVRQYVREAYVLAIDVDGTLVYGRNNPYFYAFAPSDAEYCTMSDITGPYGIGTGQSLQLPARDDVTFLGYATSPEDQAAGIVTFYSKGGYMNLYSDSARRTAATFQVYRDDCIREFVDDQDFDYYRNTYVLYPVYDEYDTYKLKVYDVCGGGTPVEKIMTRTKGTNSCLFYFAPDLSQLYCSPAGYLTYRNLGYRTTSDPTISTMADTTLYVPDTTGIPWTSTSPAGQKMSASIGIYVDVGAAGVTGTGTPEDPYTRSVYIVRQYDRDMYRLAIDVDGVPVVGENLEAMGYATPAQGGYTFENITSENAVGSGGLAAPSKEGLKLLGYATSAADAAAGVVSYYSSDEEYLTLYEDVECTVPASIAVTKADCTAEFVDDRDCDYYRYTYTLYPVYGIKLHYDANGGTGAPGSEVRVYGVDFTTDDGRIFHVAQDIPVNQNYIFVGWNNSPATVEPIYIDYASDVYVHLSSKTMYEDIVFDADECERTVYAVWWQWYQVNYDVDGGYINLDHKQALTQGTVVVDVTSEVPVKDGYTFGGWQVISGSQDISGYVEGTVYQPRDEFTVIGHTDGSRTELTLKAIWQ